MTPAEYRIKQLRKKVCYGLCSIVALSAQPATTSHAGIPQEERLRLGISDSLIRVSVGIEATSDLIADFGRALDEI